MRDVRFRLRRLSALVRGVGPLFWTVVVLFSCYVNVVSVKILGSIEAFQPRRGSSRSALCRRDWRFLPACLPIPPATCMYRRRHQTRALIAAVFACDWESESDAGWESNCYAVDSDEWASPSTVHFFAVALAVATRRMRLIRKLSPAHSLHPSFFPTTLVVHHLARRFDTH